jgi:uncharacterized repeat protein (TIGR02543 family)
MSIRQMEDVSMTFHTLPISLRLNHAARCALTSLLLCVSLLITGCGGGGDSGISTASSSSTPAPSPTPSSYTLIVSETGSGTVASSPSGINCGTSCSASYASGTSVTLTVTAATGYTFSGWSGACAGTSPTCSVSMTIARSVTATFNQNSASNATYIISWDLVTDPNVTGYKLYYATAPFSSSTPVLSIDVGSATTYAVTASALGVSTGTTVYFAVAAVGGGMESPLSSPVSEILQ